MNKKFLFALACAISMAFGGVAAKADTMNFTSSVIARLGRPPARHFQLHRHPRLHADRSDRLAEQRPADQRVHADAAANGC